MSFLLQLQLTNMVVGPTKINREVGIAKSCAMRNFLVHASRFTFTTAGRSLQEAYTGGKEALCRTTDGKPNLTSQDDAGGQHEVD
jgi:hypothetical protein